MFHLRTLPQIQQGWTIVHKKDLLVLAPSVPSWSVLRSPAACRVDAITVADEVDELFRGQMLLGGLPDEPTFLHGATPGLVRISHHFLTLLQATAA